MCWSGYRAGLQNKEKRIKYDLSLTTACIVALLLCDSLWILRVCCFLFVCRRVIYITHTLYIHKHLFCSLLLCWRNLCRRPCCTINHRLPPPPATLCVLGGCWDDIMKLDVYTAPKPHCRPVSEFIFIICIRRKERFSFLCVSFSFKTSKIFKHLWMKFIFLS